MNMGSRKGMSRNYAKNNNVGWLREEKRLHRYHNTPVDNGLDFGVLHGLLGREVLRDEMSSHL